MKRRIKPEFLYPQEEDVEFETKLAQARSAAHYGRKVVCWSHDNENYVTFSDGFTQCSVEG